MIESGNEMEFYSIGLVICMFLGAFAMGFIAGNEHGYSEGLRENHSIDHSIIFSQYKKGVLEGIRKAQRRVGKNVIAKQDDLPSDSDFATLSDNRLLPRHNVIHSIGHDYMVIADDNGSYRIEKLERGE